MSRPVATASSVRRRRRAATGSPIGGLGPGYRARVREIVESAGVFGPSEVGLALEVFDAACRPGQADYHLLGAFDAAGALVGYACYGPAAAGTWDLYWIAVARDAQGRGVGRALWNAVDADLRARGARLCVVETSGAADYAPARRFYTRLGFVPVARVADFYAPGADRLTYTRACGQPAPTSPATAGWQRTLQQSVRTIDQLVERFGAEHFDRTAVQAAIDRFNLGISPECLQQIKAPDDPFWRQYVPTAAENAVVDGLEDSLAEDADSPVPNITHRYPDRVLFLVSPVCASYCRFCTRRRKVGDPEKIPLDRFDAAFAYIAAHPEVRDVILSGGDPFMLSDRRVEYFLQRLSAIPHVEIVRIHTRIPCHLPERITPELCDVVRKYHPVYVNVHVNHPDELTPPVRVALGRLADAGCPLGCQTVLLRGVNDDPAIMRRLVRELLRCRVRPYYLYQADLVAGAEHFRTSVAKGLEIIEALRGWTSGLAVPHFVIDAPGGGGKIPLLPSYVQEVTDTEIVLRNYAGKTYRYPHPKAGLPPSVT